MERKSETSIVIVTVYEENIKNLLYIYSFLIKQTFERPSKLL